MRAVVLVGPGRAEIQDVDDLTPGAGDVVADVHRVGLCGTDHELYSGAMAYFASGRASYPLRPGHEWSGVVRAVGSGVDPAWVGVRVTGDTMLSCGACDRCLAGRRQSCRELVEVGISMGFAGALAERLRVPAASLHRLPDAVDDAAGALVEPGANAWRAAVAAEARPGSRVLVWGAGTIGLLAAAFAAAAGAEVHLVGRSSARLSLARRFGVAETWLPDDVPGLGFRAVIDATGDPDIPASAVRLIEPGGRLVCIGLSETPSLIDTRALVFGEITAIGVLGGSPGLAPTIQEYANGTVDPRHLVATTVGLDAVPDVLRRWSHGGIAPKVQVDPRL